MAHRDRGTGRERERERDRYDDRRRETREPIREREREYTSASSVARGAALNEFFVDGEGINREVLQKELCKYLGADALSRVGTYNGQKGYIVTAVRPFTSKMIEDLQLLSQDYEREKRGMNSRGYRGSPMRASPSAALPNHHTDLPYAASKTRERVDAMDPYEQDTRYIPQGRYPEREMYAEKYPEREMYAEKYPEKYPGKLPDRYPDNLYPPGYPVPSGYAPGPNYPPSPAPGYPSVSGYPSASGYPAGSTYPQGSNYPPVSGYPPSSGYVAPGYTSTSIPGGRGEPNYIYTDPANDYPSGYPYQQSGAYPGGAQANPWTGGGYPYVTSPPDSALRGAVMDERSYEMYSQQMMSAPTGRAGFPAPSRGTPTQYDTPQPLEGYTRSDAPRDERRRR
ncbi:MAG: hypothetical protein Q9173_005709 [Seirophora scorigena]